MAVSLRAGIYTGGVQLPCILYEGVATVTANVMGPDGYTDSTLSFATPLHKDEWVQLDAATENTFAATGGVPVVEPIANGGAGYIGQIITEPYMYKIPTSTPTATWTAHLAGGYYRVATVWFPCFTAVAKAVVVTTATAAITPGLPAGVKVDASASAALAASGAPDTLSLIDVASGGAGLVPLHYLASLSAASYNILVAFDGAQPVIVT